MPGSERCRCERDRGSVAVAAVVSRLQPVRDRPLLPQATELSFYIKTRTAGMAGSRSAAPGWARQRGHGPDPPAAARNGSARADVVVQELELEALPLGLELDDVPDRDDPYHLAAVNHRDVADALVGHQRHALIDCRLRRDHDQWRRHNLPNGGPLVRAPLERHVAEVVALCDDPRDLAALRHEQRPDVGLDHPLHRLEHRGVRLDPERLMALLVEDL